MPCGLAIKRLRCLEIAIHDSGVRDARSGFDDSIATWAVVPACTKILMYGDLGTRLYIHMPEYKHVHMKSCVYMYVHAVIHEGMNPHIC